MYTFRKIKLEGWKKAQWYFCPKSVTDVFDHFNVICKREISAGCKERVEKAVICSNGTLYHPHPDTPFGISVDILSNTMGMPWVQAAATLENQTLNDRLKAVRNPECINVYLADNLTWFVEYEGMKVEVLEERMLNEMEYPIETVFTYDDIRIMKWDIPGMKIRGTHYYAKVGKFDVIGKDGSLKWDTEYEARAAGIWWVDQYNRKAADNITYIHGQRYVNGKKIE